MDEILLDLPLLFNSPPVDAADLMAGGSCGPPSPPVTFKHTKTDKGFVRVEILEPLADPQPVTIDPRGDIILVLGSGLTDGSKENPHYELQVSSAVLSLTSPVFSAIFSERYKEGNNVRANAAAGKTTRIALPDDDPKAMIHLCRLFHHKSKPTELLDINELADLAMLCHKYDCASTTLIQRCADFWLQPKFLDVKNTKVLKKAILISFVFENVSVFKDLGSLYIMTAAGTRAESPEDLGYDIELPHYFYTLAAIRRAQVIRHILGALYDIPHQIISDNCEQYLGSIEECDRSKLCRMSMVGTFWKMLKDVDLKEVYSTHWRGLSLIIEDLKDVRMPNNHTSICNQEECPCTMLDVNELLSDAIKDAERVSRDMCLGCVKNEGIEEGCTTGKY